MTVGHGHNSASKAIAGQLKSKGHECDILDTYKFLNIAIGLGIDKGYALMGRIWPSLNENIYRQAERYNGRADMKMFFPWLFADLNKQKLKKYLDEYKPDIIVCSIVMTAIIISLLKETGMLSENVRTVGVVTDYSLHPFWEYTDMDYLVCPNELMIPSIVRRGVAEEKILPIGIPIDSKYAKSMPMDTAREKLALGKEKFTILISSGGLGLAGMLATTLELDKLEDTQLVVVCGTNSRLYAKMNELKLKNDAVILKYVHNMDEYMDACNLFITKPGGLSTSEAIAKTRPMLLAKPLPGIENMNLAFLINHSLAVHACKHQPASEVVLQLRKNDQKLEEMERAQTRWGKKDSAIVLGDFLERLV